MFLATSGHSGVDRIFKNLVPGFVERGFLVDLLHVEGHGPYLEASENARIINLGASHTYSCLRPVIRYLRNERPAVMLSDKDRVNRVALWAKRIAGVPTRIVVRTGTTVSKDLEKRGFSDRLMHYISMHYTYPQAYAILVPSVGAAEDLSRFAGISLDRITVVPSPIVTREVFERANEDTGNPWLREKREPVVIGVGELCPRKDFSTLIQAFSKVSNIRPCRLIILGEGSQRQGLETLIRSLGLGDRVELPGFVDNPYAYMAKADVFAHSARYEGAPVALIEALALGLPVVSTDCPSGPREILRGGRFGRLVPVGDSDAMADAIKEALNEQPGRDALREAVGPYTLVNSVESYLRALGFRIASGTPGGCSQETVAVPGSGALFEGKA